ncbi:hypothetical protein KKP04_13725 [Rhodomicrobium sp. Az07]|uniref:hypothetical protein n=1 Tax=Rhodomicrobium sp. Az07 TaxID=2839034 RepID=UPI001BE50D26|nr:hypothetical protein [Rhodomicrobium sp. Az07]MBT3071921.1 hypothetical protein [Rhodomicrobium sp. Az07]
MSYSDKAVASMVQELPFLRTKYHELMHVFVYRNYVSERGRELGVQGFLRRVNIMMHCVSRLFEYLPLDRPQANLPNDESIVGAEIAAHAFLINVYGAIDNLAWVWVCEKSVRDEKGRAVKRGNVGFWRNNTIVRTSLPAELQTYLAERDKWLDYVADWRHPLAHRVPPYIPPYCVAPSNEDVYQELERKMLIQLSVGNVASYEEAKQKQKQLGCFRPWLQGSFSESGRPIRVHQQMLIDFVTTHEMGLKVGHALDPLRPEGEY